MDKDEMFLYILSCVVIICLFSVIGAVLLMIYASASDISEVIESPLLMLIVGNTFAAVMLVLGYFYGSSKKEKVPGQPR